MIWRRSRLRILAGALAAASVLAAACVGPAAAENRFIGATPLATSAPSCPYCTQIQINTAVIQPSYVVPAGNWTITSWSMAGGTTMQGSARLVLWRADGGNGFKVVALSNFETVPPNAVTSFATSIPAQGGDILGNAIGATAGDVPVAFEPQNPAFTDLYGTAATGATDVTVGQTAGVTAPPSTYMLSPTTLRLLNINATLFRPGDGINPPLIGPNLSPPAAPVPVRKLGDSGKKCKKGRKLRRGKCVRRKRKK